MKSMKGMTITTTIGRKVHAISAFDAQTEWGS